MLLKILTADRKRYVVAARTKDDLIEKATQLLRLENIPFRLVLEDDGSILDMEVLDAVFQHEEKIGPIMFLREGEVWSQGTLIVSGSSVSTVENPRASLMTTDESGNASALASPIVVAVEESPTSGGVVRQRTWPLMYELPKMPAALVAELQAAKSMLALSSTTYHSTVRCLYEDLLQYTSYPDSMQFNCVCNAIVRRYPNLQDRVVFAERASTKHKTWLASLRTKFKTERAKLPAELNLEIQAARSKFGHKRTPTRPDSQPAAKRVCRVIVDPDANEDHETIEIHQQLLQAETQKLQVDEGLLNDRMKRTFSDRRAMVTSSSISAILEIYPCLTLDGQLYAEVERMKDVNVPNKINTFFSNERVDLILSALKGKKLAKDFLNAIGQSSNLDIQNQRRQCAFMLLPILFAESVEEWFVINKEPMSMTPTVVATGNSNELFESNILFVTQMDGVISSRPTNIFDALCSTFCLYWVYDISYNHRLAKTLSFLGCHVLKMESAKTSVAMQRRLNVLYSL